MQRLAPDVWTHAIDAEGFPTLTAVILTSRLAIVVDTLTGPRDMDPVLEFLAAEAGGRAPGGGEHAPSLGPRVRQRRLRGSGHRRPARLSAAHPGAAAGRRRVAAACRRPRASPCPTSPSETASPTADEAEIGAPHPHARATARTRWSSSSPRAGCCSPATRWSGRCPTSASETAGRSGCRTLRQLKQLPVDLVVPAHGPAMDKRHHRRQRALRRRRLRGRRRGQGRRRRPRRPRAAAGAASSPTASSSTTCTRPSTARTCSGPGTRSSRAAAAAAGGPRRDRARVIGHCPPIGVQRRHEALHPS